MKAGLPLTMNKLAARAEVRKFIQDFRKVVKSGDRSKLVDFLKSHHIEDEGKGILQKMDQVQASGGSKKGLLNELIGDALHAKHNSKNINEASRVSFGGKSLSKDVRDAYTYELPKAGNGARSSKSARGSRMDAYNKKYDDINMHSRRNPEDMVFLDSLYEQKAKSLRQDIESAKNELNEIGKKEFRARGIITGLRHKKLLRDLRMLDSPPLTSDVVLKRDPMNAYHAFRSKRAQKVIETPELFNSFVRQVKAEDKSGRLTPFEVIEKAKDMVRAKYSVQPKTMPNAMDHLLGFNGPHTGMHKKNLGRHREAIDNIETLEKKLKLSDVHYRTKKIDNAKAATEAQAEKVIEPVIAGNGPTRSFENTGFPRKIKVDNTPFIEPEAKAVINEAKAVQEAAKTEAKAVINEAKAVQEAAKVEAKAVQNAPKTEVKPIIGSEAKPVIQGNGQTRNFEGRGLPHRIKADGTPYPEPEIKPVIGSKVEPVQNAPKTEAKPVQEAPKTEPKPVIGSKVEPVQNAPKTETKPVIESKVEPVQEAPKTEAKAVQEAHKTEDSRQAGTGAKVDNATKVRADQPSRTSNTASPRQSVTNHNKNMWPVLVGGSAVGLGGLYHYNKNRKNSESNHKHR